jgi:iron(III) transport system substrate-binding protein
MGEQKGLDYFKKLAKMQPVIKSGHTVITEMAASGEIPISLNVYNHNAETLKKKGEPIEWKALQPAFGAAGGIGLTKNAPHPYAALLFADFMLSEGQQILKDRGRVPASLAVDSELNKFQYQLIDPVIVLDEWDKWSKLWSDIFLGGKALKKEEK